MDPGIVNLFGDAVDEGSVTDRIGIEDRLIPVEDVFRKRVRGARVGAQIVHAETARGTIAAVATLAVDGNVAVFLIYRRVFRMNVAFRDFRPLHSLLKLPFLRRLRLLLHALLELSSEGRGLVFVGL